MAPVTDLRDTRVMIPPTRRAIDGPAALSSGSVGVTLTDEEVGALIADALADIILYTNSVFGKALEVAERDPYYMAPIAWTTSEALTDVEQRVVVAQAALTFHYNYLRDLKVSERITNDAVEWEYSISANSLRDYLKALQDARDKALEALLGGAYANDAYYSFIATRDAATSMAIEPWVEGYAAPGGQGLADTRRGFGGFPF